MTRRERWGPYPCESPERIRDYHLRKTYGISLEQFRAILDVQNGRCPICQKPLKRMPDRDAHVDHDHGTGRIRGILCHNCNVGLGHFQDSVELLERAKEYLK